MRVQPVVDGVADGQQPLGQWRIRRGAHHVDVERDDISTAPTFHNRQPASGQSRIDAHHAHLPAPTSTDIEVPNSCSIA
jgi:hypothetical protein